MDFLNFILHITNILRFPTLSGKQCTRTYLSEIVIVASLVKLYILFLFNDNIDVPVNNKYESILS